MFTTQSTKVIAIIGILSLITACSSIQPINQSGSQKKFVDSSLKIKPAMENGTIVSKELIEISDQNRKNNIYKIFYMSEGLKVEAYLSEPKEFGQYPLYVNFHGGWAFEQPSITHETKSAFQIESLKVAPENMVIIEPQYRGYGDSEGTVQGLQGDTIDAQNAIIAAISLGDIKPDSVYLQGTSMGGAVALRTASERHDVKAIVAISPFVGWDELIHWMDSNPNVDSPQIVFQQRNLAERYKSIFKTHPETEKENSLLDRINDISAPVLFLQGTGDENVVWQTVQDFADTMKDSGKTVKLVLYPNGNHGLKDQYQKEANKEVLSWFFQYGLSGKSTEY